MPKTKRAILNCSLLSGSNWAVKKWMVVGCIFSVHYECPVCPSHVLLLSQLNIIRRTFLFLFYTLSQYILSDFPTVPNKNARLVPLTLINRTSNKLI